MAGSLSENEKNSLALGLKLLDEMLVAFVDAVLVVEGPEE
jgi:hypothetical protein